MFSGKNSESSPQHSTPPLTLFSPAPLPLLLHPHSTHTTSPSATRRSHQFHSLHLNLKHLSSRPINTITVTRLIQPHRPGTPLPSIDADSLVSASWPPPDGLRVLKLARPADGRGRGRVLHCRKKSSLWPSRLKPRRTVITSSRKKSLRGSWSQTS